MSPRIATLTLAVRCGIAVVMTAVASPVLAQEPPGQSSRGTILDQARESLTSQSTPPERSWVERKLYWYDNQYVLAKLFGGWKGIHLAGGSFPAGAGLKQNVRVVCPARGGGGARAAGFGGPFE